MKKNFLRTNWMTILITAIFVGMAIYGMDLLIGLIVIVFIGLLIRVYMRYDADEQANDEWWLNLDKEGKKKIYSERNKGDSQ